MKALSLSIIFIFCLSNQVYAFGEPTTSRTATCTTRTSVKLCSGDVVYRCKTSNYTCKSLKISLIEQIITWSITTGERVKREYVIPTDQRTHGKKIHTYAIYKLKKQCESSCQKPGYSDDDYTTPTTPPDNSSGGSSSGSSNTNSCSSSMWCGMFEHCINGQCVPQGPFNSCGGFNSCSLGETCNNGVCER